MTANAIEVVTPVIAEQGEKAVSFLNNATDKTVNENDLQLEAYVDQFRKDLFIKVKGNNASLYPQGISLGRGGVIDLRSI